MTKTWIKILLSLVVFALSFAAYYYPVHKKGFAPGASYSALAQARNFALSDTYFNESSEGVYLSSESAQEKGVPKGMTNSLTTIIYGYVFKYFGFSPGLPFYVAITLFSLFNVLVFWLVTRLFSTAIGFTTAMISAFLPVMTTGAIHSGFYEWGLVFFGLALWFYLGSKAGPFKAGKFRILTASVFFALSALARNAFAVSFVPFFLYDFFINRSYKKSLIFLLPFIVIFGSTLTSYSWLGVPNGYTADIEHQPFGQIGHFFRDPYTYYYDRENHIKEMTEEGLERVAVLFADQWGYDINFSDKLSAYFDSFVFYAKESASLTNLGGPFVWGLVLLGIFQLYSMNKKLFGLLVFWSFLWFGYLIYSLTGNWDHLMEISFIVSILAGLGLYRLAKMINPERFGKFVAGFVVLVLLVAHLAYANFWKLHDIYRSSNEEAILNAKNKISDKENIRGVYAVGPHIDSAQFLNYHTNNDVVYFAPSTIEKLIKTGVLKDAFDKYNISMAIGYSPEISSKIAEELKIPVIAQDNK